MIPIEDLTDVTLAIEDTDEDDEDVEDDEDDELEMMRTSEQVTKEVDGQRKDNCGVFLRGN